MRRVPVVYLILSCLVSSGLVLAADIDLGTASRYFREFEDLCEADGGRLWGATLCGPLLLVDPPTRMIVANRPDPAGALRPQLDVFVGTLPDDVGIANTAMEWNGTRWTMIMWGSLGGSRDSRSSLMAHEAFHRIQPELGLVAIGEMNSHLDTAKGRFWIQVEWNALQRALTSEGQARKQAISDALTFRAVRRNRFPGAAEKEIALEVFEGLAEYTGMRLAGFSRQRVIDSVTVKREDDSGFVRSFAYISGPLYGFLLDDAGIDWRQHLRPDTDLGAVLARALEVSTGSITAAPERAAAYGGSALRAAESARGLERMKQQATWRENLIEDPVLEVDLSLVSSGSFDPRMVFPLGERMTIYTTRELIAEWGRLTVTSGGILEDQKTLRAHVSLEDVADDFSRGKGWRLKLNDGWTVEPGEREGDYVVRKVTDADSIDRADEVKTERSTRGG